MASTERDELADTLLDRCAVTSIMGELWHPREEVIDAVLADGYRKVEVTDDMVEKALNVYRMRTAERIDTGAFRAALSAALESVEEREPAPELFPGTQAALDALTIIKPTGGQ